MFYSLYNLFYQKTHFFVKSIAGIADLVNILSLLALEAVNSES